jgi:hypothetical protein
MADLDPAGLEVGDGGTARLVGVVRQEAVVSHIEGLLEMAWHPAQGGLDLFFGHPKLVEVQPVEALGEATNRRVTSGPDLGEDGGHVGLALVSVVGRTRQCGLQLAAPTGESAEIDATQSHSPSMLPDRQRR